MPVRRRQSGPMPDIQKAFYDACIQAGFSMTTDTNGPNPTGVGVPPTNNLDGMRMSAAITPSASDAPPDQPHGARRRVRAGRSWFQDLKAVGVEAESGGEIFHIEGASCGTERGGYQIATIAHAVGNRPQGTAAGIWHSRRL